MSKFTPTVFPKAPRPAVQPQKFKVYEKRTQDFERALNASAIRFRVVGESRLQNGRRAIVFEAECTPLEGHYFDGVRDTLNGNFAPGGAQ